MRSKADEKELVPLPVKTILRFGGKAALVSFESGHCEWMPFSQCPGLAEAYGDVEEVQVPYWLARKKGLLGEVW